MTNKVEEYCRNVRLTVASVAKSAYTVLENKSVLDSKLSDSTTANLYEREIIWFYFD